MIIESDEPVDPRVPETLSKIFRFHNKNLNALFYQISEQDYKGMQICYDKYIDNQDKYCKCLAKSNENSQKLIQNFNTSNIFLSMMLKNCYKQHPMQTQYASKYCYEKGIRVGQNIIDTYEAQMRKQTESL